LLYLHQGLWSSAERLLREALLCEPQHRDAERRLRLLRARIERGAANLVPEAQPAGRIDSLLQRFGLRKTPTERRMGARDRRKQRSALPPVSERRRQVRRLADLDLRPEDRSGSDDQDQ
jgi:hypothetical protein